MNKNLKKGKVAPNSLIALGNNNKARNALPLQTQAKKFKTDDLNPKVFTNSIEQSMKQENGNSETILINFLNSLKLVLITSNKPMKTYLSQCLALFVICKRYPNLYSKTAVVECLINILSYNGKDTTNTTGLSSSFKPQSSMTVNPTTIGKIKPLQIIVNNILLFSLKDSTKWPLQLIKAYLEDSFTDRIWVDLPECYLLVQNIETAFPNPGIDPRSIFPLAPFSESLGEVFTAYEGGPLNPEAQQDQSDMKTCMLFNKIITELSPDNYVKPRFEHCKLAIDAMLGGYVKDIVDRRYMGDTQSRPIIRTFCSLAAIPDVRGAAVAKSDNWLSTAKVQSSTLHMLTIMASSCTQNVLLSPSDISFCVYLMFRFKYKLSKPPVQTAMLECLRKLIETYPGNLRSVLELYVTNELYGSPTVASGTAPPGPVVYSSQNKSGPVSVTFPAVFYRFPSESIKILGELLHEQLCVLHTDIRPVKLLLKDICRWIKTAHLNASGVFTTLGTSTGPSTNSGGVLLDSMELHELAQILLADRTSHEPFLTRIADPGFKQAYVENMVSIVCELQMLSVIRPIVRDAFKERSEQEKIDIEALKTHYNTLRQIRYFSCKWLKNIFRLVETHLTADQMTHYIRQVLFLNVVRSNDFSYSADESYGIGDIWSGSDSDKVQLSSRLLVKGLTEIPLSDKLVQTLINLGFEKHMCFRPSEIVNMIAELIVRASASSCWACPEIVPMSLLKGETIINNMFACCSYDVVVDETDPKLQIARTLAYKASFWKVCQALVVMASHCTATCGAYLWHNFPTVRNLMQVVITNNFEELYNDKEAMETERQFCETDAKKICELETLLIEAAGESNQTVEPGTSKLVSLLLFNLPQGPVRQPPPAVLEALHSMNTLMKIGDRLSQCRSPDFLFEIVRQQDQSKISSRKWIIDLVKKTSDTNLDGLPLLCLTEFIYHDLHEKIARDATAVVTESGTQDVCLKRLVHKIRTILSGTEAELGNKESLKNIVGALSNSFFNRLSDSSTFIRKVARECLFILLRPVTSPIQLMEEPSQFAETLKSIMNLNILQDSALICSVAEALRETLKFETDIDVLHSYIELFAVMSAGSHKEWLGNTVETISILMLNRPIIADKLRQLDYEMQSRRTRQSVAGGNTSPGLVSESLAQIFLAHCNYTAYQAQVVPLEHRDEAVMVQLRDKQFPVVVKVIQSQLALLCWGGAAKSRKCKRLVEFWFNKAGPSNSNTAIKHQLPEFQPLEPTGTMPIVIADWLVDAAVLSGHVPVMLGVLEYRVRVTRSLAHSISPALAFMPPDFLRAYLQLMNSLSQPQDSPSLVDAWLATVTTRSQLASMVAIVSKMHSKIKAMDTTFKTRIEAALLAISTQATSTDSATVASGVVTKGCDGLGDSERPNLVVKSIVVRSTEKSKSEDSVAMDTSTASTNNIWQPVIQSHCEIGAISQAIGALIAPESTANKSLEPGVAIDNLFQLLKDARSHSETLRVLNKGDYKLMPLLKLTFGSRDGASFEHAQSSLRFLFQRYPHIEKSALWKAVYHLSLAGAPAAALDHLVSGGPCGIRVASDIGLGPVATADEQQPVDSAGLVKSLAKSIMQGCAEDAAHIGPKIDRLTVLGLGNGCRGSLATVTKDGPTFSESHFEMLHKLLFSSHAPNRYSDYFMGDLLHQSNMFSLRQILHSILGRRSISQMNASRVLDFIDACLHHPRLQYSVQLPVTTATRQAAWPQQNEQLELTELELGALLALVVSETEHLIEQNGPEAVCVATALQRRVRLIDTCSASALLVGDRLALIARFIESKPHNPAAEKLGLALYSRLPSLVLTTVARDPAGIECQAGVAADGASDEEYEVSEVYRVGHRLLAGLVSGRLELQELAVQALKALVSRHPRLCVQLLPYMCALSDGVLDGTDIWHDFRKKRGPVLCSNLLHLLELMSPYSTAPGIATRPNTKRLLFNFLRVLIRYRDQHKSFGGFVTRFVGFLEKMIPPSGVDVGHDADESSGGAATLQSECNRDSADFIVEHSAEITALSRVYPQFRNLVVHVQPRHARDSSLSVLPSNAVTATVTSGTSGSGDLDEATRCSTLASQTAQSSQSPVASSQQPLLRLELLANFRRKLRETQSGSGILVQIRDLEDVSKRDTSIIGLFLDNLRGLLSHSMGEVRLATVHILTRYLNTFPEGAARIVTDCLLSGMMRAASGYWARPFVGLALKTLCQTGMLAPAAIPACMSAHARLLVSGNHGPGSYRDSIELLEVVIDNMSLESLFMDTPSSSSSSSSGMGSGPSVTVASSALTAAAAAAVGSGAAITGSGSGSVYSTGKSVGIGLGAVGTAGLQESGGTHSTSTGGGSGAKRHYQSGTPSGGQKRHYQDTGTVSSDGDTSKTKRSKFK